MHKDRDKKAKAENIFTITPLESEGAVSVTWNDNCTNLLEERHRKTIDQINNRLEKLKPKKLLVDLFNCSYVITPKTGNWYENTLFGLFAKSRPDAIAFVVPSNLFNHIFFEAERQIMTESDIKTQYFRDKEKAIEWLRGL